MSRRQTLFATLVMSVLAMACTELRVPRSAGGEGDATECYVCHGELENGNPAAPPASWRDTAGEDPHQAHLQGADWRPDIACETCHIVPDDVSAAGHNDTEQPAEIIFNGAALLAEASPTYADASRNCNGVYCHGATLDAGGTSTEPVWALIDGDLGCQSCHGAPPALPHPQNEDCGRCHGTVIDSNGVFVDRNAHINGRVDVMALECDSCHGSNGNSAPPLDLAGNTETSARGVGAHRAHLDDSDWHTQITCNECHTVPQAFDDAGHIDAATPADLNFGDLAMANEATPTFVEDTLSCSGVYCHGATVDGGAVPAPVWTEGTDGDLACDSCHGTPPGGDHPIVSATSCSLCHGDVVDDDLNIVSAERHINGILDVDAELPCNGCHGSADGDPSDPLNWAPPFDLDGEVEHTSPGVGAHQAHLQMRSWAGEVMCDDCHEVPESVSDPAHIDGDGMAEVDFSVFAGGNSASYDSETSTCSGIYCHGANWDSGGAVTEPDWTLEDEAACGNCHSLPPPSPHPDNANCGACHEASYADGAGNPDLHMNGRTDLGN